MSSRSGVRAASNARVHKGERDHEESKRQRQRKKRVQECAKARKQEAETAQGESARVHKGEKARETAQEESARVHKGEKARETAQEESARDSATKEDRREATERLRLRSNRAVRCAGGGSQTDATKAQLQGRRVLLVVCVSRLSSLAAYQHGALTNMLWLLIAVC